MFPGGGQNDLLDSGFGRAGKYFYDMAIQVCVDGAKKKKNLAYRTKIVAVIDGKTGAPGQRRTSHCGVLGTFGNLHMGHLILGCPGPVGYRKKEKWHKKGWSD